MARIGFIGCHEISWFCLKKICELSKRHNDEIVTVFNLDLASSKKHSAYIDFNSLQQEFHFELQYISNVTDNNSLNALKNSQLDILFIVGWHRIVPQTVLEQAKICLGIHSSKLPKDRGSSPINWQLIRGDNEGGVTLFHLTTGVDEGPIVDIQEYEILEFETVRDVYFKATTSSLLLLERNWSDIHNLTPKKFPQNELDMTLNIQRKPCDGLINWNTTSKTCHDWIRALTHPYPGAFTYWDGKKILLWSSIKHHAKNKKPGEILEVGKKIIVSTIDGSLELLSLQVENEPICNAELFSKSYNLIKGNFFENQ